MSLSKHKYFLTKEYDGPGSYYCTYNTFALFSWKGSRVKAGTSQRCFYLPRLNSQGNSLKYTGIRRLGSREVKWLARLNYVKNKISRASLVAQWLRIHLPMQGTRVWALVWEDPTCRGATRPVSHNYWACASGACAPQQERPRSWEACAPRWRVAPARRN